MKKTACRYQFYIKVSAHKKFFVEDRELRETWYSSSSVLNIIVTEAYFLKDEPLHLWGSHYCFELETFAWELYLTLWSQD